MQSQQSFTEMQHVWVERSEAFPAADRQQQRDRRMWAPALSQLKRANTALAERDRELDFALAQLDASQRQLRAAQLKLIQLEKMRCVGSLAAGVAHEVKNPLAIISLGAEYLLGHVSASDPATATVLHEIQEAVGRAESVVRGLLDFSAPGRLEATVADLNQVVRQSLLLVRQQLLRRHVQTVAELAADLPQLRLDTRKMEQAFINLFMNAAQAMPGGGTLTVRSRVESDCYVVEIEDTGPGFSPLQLGRIFEPFFTTKVRGEGNGLGLPVCKCIVELHGGTIRVANRQKGGARVTIILKAGV